MRALWRLKAEAGFNVTVAYGLSIPCIKVIRQFQLSLGDYTVCDYLYVFELGGAHMVMGIQ